MKRIIAIVLFASIIGIGYAEEWKVYETSSALPRHSYSPSTQSSFYGHPSSLTEIGATNVSAVKSEPLIGQSSTKSSVIYTPFSDESPTVSEPRRMAAWVSDDWDGPSVIDPGEPMPIGDDIILILFAIIYIIVTFKKRHHETT